MQLQLDIYRARALPCGAAWLSPCERRWLARQGFGTARRREWIRGRVAVRRSLGGRRSLLADRDGAPRLWPHGRTGVSLSHEGGLIAVVLADDARVAVDVTLPRDRPRLVRALARLRLRGVPLAPELTWAALECALKLRRLGIAELLDRSLRVSRTAELIVVRGLGPPMYAHSTTTAQFTVVWAGEQR